MPSHSQGRTETQKALEQLRKHIQENPKTLQSLHVQSAVMMRQFTDGVYVGIPHREEVEEAEAARTRMSLAFGIVLLLVITAVALFYASKFF